VRLGQCCAPPATITLQPYIRRQCKVGDILVALSYRVRKRLVDDRWKNSSGSGESQVWYFMFILGTQGQGLEPFYLWIFFSPTLQVNALVWLCPAELVHKDKDTLGLTYDSESGHNTTTLQCSTTGVWCASSNYRVVHGSVAVRINIKPNPLIRVRRCLLCIHVIVP
jgi:hypothetical protein